jgi:hypothetical protein
MIAMTFAPKVPIDIKCMCHQAIASYFLATLKAIEIQRSVDRHHASESHQVLFAQWEQEDEAGCATLPRGGVEALEMRRQADGSGIWTRARPNHRRQRMAWGARAVWRYTVLALS